MNPPESILEKIRALLRLAKSDNAHEASLAMQKAVELATKHALDLSDISPDDDLNKIVGEHLHCPSRLAREWHEAFVIVQTFFNVNLTVLQGAQRVLFVGTKLDIEIADYICTYLVRCCRESLSRFRATERAARRKTSGPKIANYIEGFFTGIYSNLHKKREEQKAESNRLALVLQTGKQAREVFSRSAIPGKITTLDLAKPRTDRRASFHGFVAGQKTQLNPGLRGNNTTLALH